MGFYSGEAPDKINYRQQLQDLKDFITFKDIKISEDELKEFVASRRLAEKMSEDPSENRLKFNWTITEKIGLTVVNPKCIAKIKL